MNTVLEIKLTHTQGQVTFMRHENNKYLATSITQIPPLSAQFLFYSDNKMIILRLLCVAFT